MSGDPPAWMQTLNPHAHHILYKKGIKAAQQDVVDRGQAILRRHGIDPIMGPENLCWAPNIEGQHVLVNVEEVVTELEKLETTLGKAGHKEEFADLLQKLGKKAAARTRKP